MGTESFNRSGDGWVVFTIPAGVETLTNLEIRGGGAPGNAAGLVTGSIDVKKINAIVMYLGEAGHPNAAGTGGAGGAAGHRDGHDQVGAGGKGGNSTTGNGGDGGGSGTAVWARKADGSLGRLLAVAGGAGGDSGFNGGGGLGGAAIGGDGKRGDTNGGVGPFTAATGGRQNEGGFGGISPQPAHNGQDAERTKLGKAGNGHNDTHGGGGGGSGYYSGGGGQGGITGIAPDGGGAGGSNFIGGMHKGSHSNQGGGGTGNGSVTFYWQKKKANHPPTPPSSVKVNGRPENTGMSANTNNKVVITAKISDPDHDKVRLVAQISRNKNFSNAWPVPAKHSAWVQIKKNNEPVLTTVTFDGLKPGIHYYVRLWSQDEHGLLSLNYTAIDFWTNRGPLAPVLTGPPNYMLFPDTATVDFTWQHNDPDGAPQSAFRLRYRVAGTPSQDPLPWHHVGGKNQMVVSSTESWSIDGDAFLGNYRYEWQVRTRDNKNRWSPWSVSRQFSTHAVLTPPQLEEPLNGSSVDEGVDTTFTWRHVNWQSGQVQVTADFQFRVADPDVPDEDAIWFHIFGTADSPGADTELTVPGEYDFGAGLQTTFVAGRKYAWQVRTYTGAIATPSQWSEPFYFTAVLQPGSAIEPIDPDAAVSAGRLGCGDNRVMVVTRPIWDKDTQSFHQVTLGEITPITSVTWSRLRDDISSCLVTSVGFGDDCGELLASLRSWQHELVVYRDGVRAWEGPITRIAYYTDRVEVEAKDPMIYVYRRVMRVGYNDTYRKVHGVIIARHGRSVVERATRIIQDALCYDDPNVLAYLTRLDTVDDAPEGRSLAAYQKTAWEEIDDLAATGGLDYTCVGRRIILNDVHNAIGRLPIMRSGDFSADPVVTEYGMAMANVFFVSSARGQWGSATPEGDGTPPLYYPYVEQLTSAYGESADDAKKTVTADSKLALSEKLADQAERHIASRWPAPVMVRVPDNAVLSPDLEIGINQLIPGVWIPVQATNTLREVTQWQKLDSVTVRQTGEEPEQITVILTPAPLGEDDELEVEDAALKTDDGTAT